MAGRQTVPSGDGTSGSTGPLGGQLQGCPRSDPHVGFWLQHFWTGLLGPALSPGTNQSCCWGSWRLVGVRGRKLGRSSEWVLNRRNSCYTRVNSSTIRQIPRQNVANVTTGHSG